MSHQDWKPVVWTKPPDKKKNAKKGGVAISNTNKNLKSQGTGKKIKEDGEIQKVPTVGMAIGKQIAQARNAKKLTQKQLASQMSITAQMVQLNENGKAIKNNALLAKFERALGTKFDR